MAFRTDIKQLVLSRWGAAVVILVLLAGGAVYLFHYTQMVIPVMKYVDEDTGGALYWPSGPSGTFFLFPKKPGIMRYSYLCHP